MTHTIILMQPHFDKSSRTFTDHETVQDAVEAFIRGYEERLKELNPQVRNLKYEIKDLMKYVDNMPDLGVLSFDNKIGGYVPHSREWLKDKIYVSLERALKSSK